MVRVPRLFDSLMEVAPIEPGKAEVWVVRDVFKDLRQGGSADPTEQGLKSGTDQGQGASRVGIAEQAGVFAPLGIAHPVAAFATPVGPDDGRQARSVGLGVVQAADKVTGDVRPLLRCKRVEHGDGHDGFRYGCLSLGFLELGGLGLGGIGKRARLDQTASLGEVTRGGVGEDGAEFTQFLPTMAAVGGRKRGGAPANCPWA